MYPLHVYLPPTTKLDMCLNYVHWRHWPFLYPLPVYPPPPPPPTHHPFQLLGRIDVDTREWTDGVLTSSARQVVKEAGDVHSWIVCDGDIDPEWIESLNSVLDDNRWGMIINWKSCILDGGMYLYVSDKL